MRRATFVLLLSLGCVTSPPPVAERVEAPPPPAAPEPPKPAPPGLRLPEGIRPRSYTASLTVRPEADTFKGSIEIALTADVPAEVVWLHVNQVTIDRATLRVGPAAREGQVVATGDEMVALWFGGPVPAGEATLALDYRGEVSNKDWRGIFRQREGDDWYLFTQGESTHARQIFPCFDEPGFKVPWQLTLEVPAALVALSNTPVEAEAPGADGMKRVTFARTRPLPSYLLAFAVGPFDLVDAGTVGKAPLRIAAFKGRAAEAADLRPLIQPALERLEAYFGMPYPYEKLDLVPVPMFFGAMENPGLVTWSAEGVLWTEQERTIRRIRSVHGTLMHELAHMWFGDLVTMQWWDDLWLNESFAEWLAEKLVDEWHPEWEGGPGRLRSRSWALMSDSRVTARAIRQPIAHKGDIRDAFDGITYQKGEQVLGMLEAWIGAETFREGLRRYMRKHSDGNTTAADFFGALSEAAGRDVAPVFRSFVDQPGVPLLTMKVECPKGGAPRLSIAQERYLPLGTRAPPSPPWRIPACVRTEAGRHCTLLEASTGAVELPGKCPRWLVPNDGITGYYRSRLEPGAWRALWDGPGSAAMTVTEQAGLFGDYAALALAGDVAAGDVLRVVPRLVKTQNRHLIGATTGMVSGLERNQVPDRALPAFRRFIVKTYGPLARQLGLMPRPEDDENTRLLRPQVLSLVGDAGRDPKLIAEATRLARAWLADDRAVPRDMAGTILGIAARDGDAALYEEVVRAAKAEKDRTRREAMLDALAGFEDPELVKRNLALVRSGEFDARETMSLLFAGTARPTTRELAFRNVAQHFDAVAASLPEDMAPMLFWVGASMCDRAEKAAVEGSLKPHAAKFPGGDRMLARILESVEVCAAQKEKQVPSVEAFLRAY